VPFAHNPEVVKTPLLGGSKIRRGGVGGGSSCNTVVNPPLAPPRRGMWEIVDNIFCVSQLIALEWVTIIAKKLFRFSYPLFLDFRH
jgi:hypothetical protein